MNLEPTHEPSAPDDPLFGNRASDLFRCALDSPPPAEADRSVWQPPPPELLQQMLPGCRIDALIGRGGMGAVYRGRQISLDRGVAVKVLPAELAAGAEFVSRFQREAQLLARLQHPGIVAVHDSGRTAAGHLYFVMELVEGTDLQRVIHGPGLAPDQALELTVQICEALHYAHHQGVVHRDIKPANVLVTREGRAKLADFGLARPLSTSSGAGSAASLAAGTPDYMAPEQWTGHGDHRADIYALGVMLYEMLTGVRPQGAFDLPSQRARVDARLDGVVVKAMRQEPERRYQQVSELRQDVEHIRDTEPPSMQPPTGAVRDPAAIAPHEDGRARHPAPGWRWKAALTGALLLALLLSADGIWRTLKDRAPSRAETAVQPSAQQPEGGRRDAAAKEEAGGVAATGDRGPENPAPAAPMASMPGGEGTSGGTLIFVSETAPPVVKKTAPATLPAPRSLVDTPQVPSQTGQPAAGEPTTAAPVSAAQPSGAAAAPPAVAAQEPLITLFSREAPNLMTWALAPLEEEIPGELRQKLTFLREDLIDEGKIKPAASLDAYRAAYYLCEAILSAMTEREQVRVAAGYRAVQGAAAQAESQTSQALEARRNYLMSWPQHAREAAQRGTLQERAVARAAATGEMHKGGWAARMDRLRAGMDSLYRQFRGAMRQ